MAYSLIIDTSTERSLIAISKNLDCCFINELPFGYQSSKHLISAIVSGFETLNIKASDLKCIAVATGPGSFTGIRVGVAAASGLKMAAQCPLIGFGSLEGFISKEEGSFASVIDARMGGAYVLMQKREKDQITVLGDPSRMTVEDLKQLRMPIVGPFLERLGIVGSETAPDASHLARVVEIRFKNQEYNPNGSVPINYLSSLYA